MVTEAIETYVIVCVFGFVIGVVASRFFYKNIIQRNNLGTAIGFALIDKQITQLESMTIAHFKIVDEMKACSDEIIERIELIKDIEESIIPREKKPDSMLELHEFNKLTEMKAVP